MRKTCRTCRFSAIARECNRRRIWVSDTEFCGDYEPRDTPLLVDQLAAALDAILCALSKDWHLPAWKEAQRLYDQAEKALIRHQQES